VSVEELHNCVPNYPGFFCPPRDCHGLTCNSLSFRVMTSYGPEEVSTLRDEKSSPVKNVSRFENLTHGGNASPLELHAELQNHVNLKCQVELEKQTDVEN
jgi:hypothetical protein